MNYDKASAIIKKYEGLKLEAYVCPAGVPTIGWGHTAGVKIGDKINEAQAEGYFQQDLQKRAINPVERLVKTQLNENQMNALVSFVFNIGEGNFAESSLLRMINNGRFSFELMASEFLKWNKGRVNGALVVLPGLNPRRVEESKLFLA